MSADRTKSDHRAAKRSPGTVLDLFSGCGGLSLGFQAAGFEILGGVEIDPIAAATHGLNFHPDSPAHACPRDAGTSPRRLLRSLGIADDLEVDVLVGGPPCQAFARVGRAKLRSESKRRRGPSDHRAWLNDPRAGLYAHYLEYVDVLRPAALVMENVPDVLNHGGQNIAEQICEELELHGYDVGYTLLNAAHFGVPQMRERMFLIGLRDDLRTDGITFPAPTHAHELPRGYGSTRACALHTLGKASVDGTGTDDHYVSPSRARQDLPRAVTVAEALEDLPEIPARFLSASGELRRGRRRLDEPQGYRSAPAHPYGRIMREWPEFPTERVTAHVIRHLPRDFRIFAEMRAGDQYPQAVVLAKRLLDRELGQMHKRPAPRSAAFRQLEAEFVPPYDPDKFPNKWRKMEPDAPARTLMAHLGKDSYSHIHHDSRQARTISVRDAARLQSFPDGFRFAGSMNAGFRQIGNAVPPLVAYALARHIRTQLGLSQRRDFRRHLGLLATPGSTETFALERSRLATS